MSEVARLYRYKGLLSGRVAVSAAELQAELEISPATFKRDIAKLRDQLHVPIVFDREMGGYRMAQGHTDTELPGLWFSHDELLALLTIQQLLSQLEPTVLAPTLKPIQGRLTQLMSEHGLDLQDVAKKILMLSAKKRALPPKLFEAVAAATMGGKRIQIVHSNRHTATTAEREVSPLRLVHYRDNWYLDAWCHLRGDLRSFAVDAIDRLTVLDTPAKEVPQDTINARIGAGYGIFSGAHTTWATLKFSPKRSQWVVREVWHPHQKTQLEPDGSLLLSIPYSDDRELVGDIMRFGPEVEVLAPPGLKTKVQNTLLAAIGRYVK
jgi:predicted DNA-binding transcriptional regulator YafY